MKDVDHPYNAVKDFRWYRGYQVGGRSLLWARHCFRWSDLDFEANAREGVGIDWPIRYEDIEPWYDHVEEFIGVSGENAGLPQLPDGKLLPPFEMNCIEQHFREQLKTRFTDRQLISSRARRAQPAAQRPRRRARARNLCHRGCPYGAYFSSNSSTLPAAAATGNMTLRPHSIAHSIITDPNTGRATGVRVIDAETHETTEFFAKVVFLNASALNTTALLLNSKSPQHPNGFAQLERRARPLPDGPPRGGRRHRHPQRLSGQVLLGTPEHERLHPALPQRRDTKHQDFTRGFAYEVYTGRAGLVGAGWTARHGRRVQGLADEARPLDDVNGSLRRVPASAREHGLAELRQAGQVGHADARHRHDVWPQRAAMRKDMQASAVEMLKAAGFENVEGFDRGPHPGEVIHEMGTARMGADPKQSVVNAHNQCHDASNVFVTDGACMASTACQNPSLTYMALTARACAFAVEHLKRGDL